MTNPKSDKELPKLLNALCDNRLDEAGMRRLAERLTDREARQYYLKWMQLHADLTLRQGAAPAAVSLPEQPAGFRWLQTLGWLLPAIAALLLLAFFLRLPTTPYKPSDPGVAKLISAENLVWETPQPQHTDAVLAGRMKIRSGTASFKMHCGAELVMDGPVEVELIDSKAIRLVSGRVRLDVPDAGVGFRVVTPSADVVDLGTTFSVAVDAIGDTRVHVAEGVVVARSMQDDGVVPLLTREGAHIDWRSGDFASIDFDPTGFVGMASTYPPAIPLADSNPIPPDSRIVFLGDAVTDRETHLLLMAQATAELPEGQRPQFFNAGISFPLFFEEAEFQQQVAILRPTHAVLEFGSEIATYREPRSPERFAAEILRLTHRLEAAEIVPILETTILSDDAGATAQAIVRQYNQQLRQLASQHGYRLIDFQQLADARTREAKMWLAPSGQNLTLSGYRALAELILQKLLEARVTVPEQIEPILIPGTLTEWRIRFKKDAARLTADEVASLATDSTWTHLSLPQPPDKLAIRNTSSSHLVSHRDRLRGMATGLWSADHKGLEAVTVVESPEDRRVWLNTGATLNSVWINGEQVYNRPKRKWTGWHAGRQRIPVDLRAGKNPIVIEADNSFFVGLTDVPDWSVQ